MKILHIAEAADSSVPIEFDDKITLVRDLDPARRSWLIAQLGCLGRSGSLDATGELEAHGIRFDLDHASLALLAVHAEPSDVVVSAQDLSGHHPNLAAVVAARTEAARARDLIHRRLETNRARLVDAVAERDAVTEELDEMARGEGRARPMIDARAATSARLETELKAARSVREQAKQDMASAATELEQAAEQRNVGRGLLDAARVRRRRAVSEATLAAAALEEATSGSHVEPDQQAPEVECHADRVANALVEVLDASQEEVPVVAALALADSWRDLHQQISALEAGVSDAERIAEHQVALARRTLSEAELEFNQPILTPEQISKVEAAHYAVLEAQERAEGRFGGARARRRLEDLRSDERRVLERLGFSTYADYMMSSSNRGGGLSNRAVLDTAREHLAAATEGLSTIPGAVDRARRRIELLQRRDALAPRVADLLGHEPTGPEAEDELRLVREVGPAGDPSTAALAEALIGAGTDIGPCPHERDDVVLLARAYLADASDRESVETEVPDVLDVAPSLHADRGRSEEIAGLEAKFAAAIDAEAAAAASLTQAEVDFTDGAEPRVVAASERLAAAEQALVEVQALEDRLVEEIGSWHGTTGAEALMAELEEVHRQAETVVETTSATEQTAVAALDAADRALSDAIDVEVAAQSDAAAQDRGALLEEFEWQLLARLARLRSVGPGGSLPLVLDDPFGALHDEEIGPVLDRLGSMAGAVQVVVISDRTAVAAWAAKAGPARVAVLAAA